MKHLLFVLLSLPLCVFGEGGLPTQPYIYVEGKAEMEKPADMVTLRFELSALQPEQPAANKLVQVQANKTFALLKAAGVPDKDVIASDLNSEAEYEEGDESTPHKKKLLGYRVTRPFTVKVREIGKFPQLVNDLLALKVHEFTSIAEGLSNAEELEDQVWEKAVANARERAEKTLKSTGSKIESIFAISPVAFPQIYRKMFGDTGEEGQTVYSMAEAAKVEPAQYRLAPVAINQSVHVIYLISAAK